MSWQILVTARSFCRTSGPHHEVLAAQGCYVDLLAKADPYSAEALREVIAGYDGAILGLDHCTAEVIGHAPQLKVISRYGVGVDNVDLEAAKASNIKVFNTPGANTTAVAEHTLALLFGLARSLPQVAQGAKEKQWLRQSGWELSGKQLGLIGFGTIGRAVAERALALGMTVLAYDPYVEVAALPVELGSLEAVLSQADVVSLHTALTPETTHLIAADTLQQMRQGAYLINTARGELIDEAALYDTLAQGHLAGAALDAFSHDPPTESPLLTLPQVIATPHIAGTTGEAVQRMSMAATQNLLDGLRNHNNPNRIV